MSALWLTTLVPIFVSFVLTFLMRRVSLSRGLMDVPNERSSHVAPTPRGGGVAIVLTSLAAFGILWVFRLLDLPLFAALTGGGLAVALVGLIDDRRPLSARTRLVVHSAAALWALLWLVGTAGLHDARVGTAAELAGFLLAVTVVVWVLNLYNFMDGIDGIAAAEAVFVSWAGAFLLLAAGSSGLALAALAFGASCCGFLFWNWPPAKIFMGDVGSGYIGYTIAVLVLGVARDDPGLWSGWVILNGVFVIDATVTLTRRLFRGDRVFSAHRSHAYQWLSRGWNSHKWVTLLVSAINLLWLLPWAWAAERNPTWRVSIMAIAWAPLVVLALFAGAGRREVV